MKLKIFTILIIFMFFSKKGFSENYDKVLYDFKIESITGELIDLNEFQNKVVLITNTASYCGFTKQYSDLQKLWQKYKEEGLIVLGVPSNSFNQEKSNEKDVKDFCEVNFNINFPMTKITEVKGEDAHEIFKWAKKNYGKSAVPKWNFHKIIIGKDGKIHDTFASITKPTSKKFLNSVNKALE